MKKIIKIMFLASCGFFILAGCELANNPVANFADYVTGKVQIEQKLQADKTLATVKCQELCQNILSSDGENMAVGPCLNNEIIPDWVCDVAHSPRTPEDNDPKNQCSNFRDGKAHHYVEIDGNCNLIKNY
ncbi:MAG: hypothetical protein WC768_05280 [Patescibacteria group bacterium]